jgi:phage/plasmid-associated DNA primase
MELPYDVFNDIIMNADMKTILHLYNTNSNIRELCMNDPFTKVLIEFSKNQYFNLEAESNTFNDFLNDVTYNNKEMLKDLQLTFGSFLMGKPLKKIVVLNGDCNGKSTFLSLLNQLLGYRFVNSTYSCDQFEYYQDAYILRFQEYEYHNLKYIPRLKQLSGGDNIFTGYNYNPQFNIVIAQNNNFDSYDQVFNSRLKYYTFKTRYVNVINGVNQKLMNHNIKNLLIADNALPALLNFLLQGCRDFIKQL